MNYSWHHQLPGEHISKCLGPSFLPQFGWGELQLSLCYSSMLKVPHTTQEGIFTFVSAKLNRVRRNSKHQVPSQTLPCTFSISSRCVWTPPGDAAPETSSLRHRPSGSPLSASKPFLWVWAVLEPGASPLPMRTPVPAWDIARGHHKVTIHHRILPVTSKSWEWGT